MVFLRQAAWEDFDFENFGKILEGMGGKKLNMKMGTKSLLFGVHQIILHPLFVLAGWVKLYSWPNWKELVCIIIHDWGYWGCADMDGDEGEEHPEWAAGIVNKYLDGWENKDPNEYYYLCLLHSRFWSKKLGPPPPPPSDLCWADKLGSVLMPWWLWYGLGRLTGEYFEYINCMKHREVLGEGLTTPKEYFMAYRSKVMEWVENENNN